LHVDPIIRVNVQIVRRIRLATRRHPEPALLNASR
jgi:hypothetical protein